MPPQAARWAPAGNQVGRCVHYGQLDHACRMPTLHPGRPLLSVSPDGSALTGGPLRPSSQARLSVESKHGGLMAEGVGPKTHCPHQPIAQKQAAGRQHGRLQKGWALCRWGLPGQRQLCAERAPPEWWLTPSRPLGGEGAGPAATEPRRKCLGGRAGPRRGQLGPAGQRRRELHVLTPVQVPAR